MDMNTETPWGKPQTIGLVAEGIYCVSTARHGGIMLSLERTTAMPDYMRTPVFAGKFTTYEEDCDWCMPVLIFESEFRSFHAKEGVKSSDKIIREARSALRHWRPEIYETFYKVILAPGESRRKDEQQFYIDNKANLLVVGAWGDWKDGVPKGMVALRARLGGHMNKDASQERFFLIPASEYDSHRCRFAFIVDPTRHQEIPALA